MPVCDNADDPSYRFERSLSDNLQDAPGTPAPAAPSGTPIEQGAAMTQQKPLSPKATVALGLLVTAVGAFIVLQALGVIPAGRMNAPPWVGVLAGLVFSLAGIAVILGVVGGAGPNGDLPPSAPLWVRVGTFLVGLTMFASFAMIGSWIAFGPGVRHFGTNVPFLQSGTANEIGGRIAFGFGAILVWLCTIGFAIAGGRKLLSRRCD